MLVEYLFEVNPLTILFICAATVFLIYYQTLPSHSSKNKLGINNLEGIETKFIQVNKGSSKDKEEEITVMSYNILAYNFTKASWFSYCDVDFLQPKYRCPRILNEIRDIKADIICLQECDHDLFHEFYRPNLESLGYESIINLANPNRIVTIVIAYNKSRLTLVKKDHVDLNEELGKLDESFVKHKEALVVLFKHKNTGKQFVVANTHLFWNPEFEYVKYGQTVKVIKHIEKNYKDVPLIVAGDFNSMPWSNVMRYIYKLKPTINSNTKGEYNMNKKYMEKFFDEEKNSTNLRSAYDVYRTALTGQISKNKIDSKNVDDIKFNEFADNHPHFTVLTEEFCGCLDYIFYNDDKLTVTELLEIPNSVEITNLKLPNYKYPSDHMKIATRFSFN